MKKHMKAYVIAGISLVLAAAAGFGLPGLLLRFGDEQQLGQIEQEKVSPMEITDQPVLSIVEKVRLMQRASSNSMALEKGRNYSQETIAGQISGELQTLAALDIPGIPENPEDAEVMAEPVFMMDVEGENSFIVWNAALYADGWGVELSMDDETGKILSLNCYGSVEMSAGSGSGAAENFGDYLGCHVAQVRVSDYVPAEYWDSSEMRDSYQEEIQNQAEAGSTWEEAKKQVDEKWGLGDLGYLAVVSYGDESGLEALYRISVSTESGMIQILPQ